MTNEEKQGLLEIIYHPVVISRPFINFASQSRSKNKIIIFFLGDVNYEANFVFFFYFIRELNIYSPL